MSQLAKLAEPFPAAYIKKPPKGKYGEYVEHSDITQALLATLGPYDFRVKEFLYGFVPEREAVVDAKTGEIKRKAKPPIERTITGVVCALTVTVDERTVTVEEIGDCEDPHNWPTEGARAKDAVSDAIKRCAMRLGLGLHLWAQDHYFLNKSLAKTNGNGSDPERPL